MERNEKGHAGRLKFGLGLALTMLTRLFQFFPNVEPILAGTLPFAKKQGPWTGAAFAFLALASFDFVSGRLGLWTLYTGITYALVGYAGGKYFEDKGLELRHRLGFAIGATLFYDAVTALLFGWQFGQPLMVTLAGQVPFTLYHLLGNVAAVTLLTPLLNAALVENPQLDAMTQAWKKAFSLRA